MSKAVKMYRDRMDSVENKFFGKLLRTIGFLLLLVSGVVLLLNNLSLFEMDFINNIINPVLNFLNNNLSFLNDYILLGMVVGILLLIWTVSRKPVLNILTTVFILVAVVAGDLTELTKILPFTLPSLDFLDGILNAFEYDVLTMQIVSVIFVMIVLGKSKPKKASKSLLNVSMLVLTVFLVLAIVPLVFPSISDIEIIFTILLAILSLGLLLQVLASVFGVLGFARK